MTREEILAEVRALATAQLPFVFATVDENDCPQMRWMGGLVLEEPMTIYMASNSQARKMHQIRSNQHGQLMFQSADFAQVINMCGRCEICEDAAIKQKVWEALPILKNFNSGPEDPGLGIVKLTVKRVELLRMKELGWDPLVVEL